MNTLRIYWLKRLRGPSIGLILAAAVVLATASLSGWAGDRTSPSGHTIDEDVVASGGVLGLSGAGSVNGTVGQVAVGLSLVPSGAALFHGVHAPILAGEGEGEGEEGEGAVEGAMEGSVEGGVEGEEEGQIEGEPAGLVVQILGESPVYVPKGQDHTFNTVVSGQVGNVSYAWYFEPAAKEFTEILNANDSSYTVEDASDEHAGFYVCQASDDVMTVDSNTAELIVTAGVPAAGPLGLILLVACAAAASTLALRRKRQT
ncbi:MAG TPA: immunoglobulin domain-containing protein [Candidatus Hydrogenedentes bacterium]|mgnify:CR=1 FL=1|nr:immunoglobulin domain-containing protein [Candidatus Hydrogenedentota bacterium]